MSQPTLFFDNADRWSRNLGDTNGARFLRDDRFRTMLWRTFPDNAAEPPLIFAMLNPSTADAALDDPTIRRCIGFAVREKAGGIIVVNLSPFRATDPKDLFAAADRGLDVLQREENRAAFREAVKYGPVVFAWGAHAKEWMREAQADLFDEARAAKQPIYHLGRTKHGEPRHPLMLRADTPLERLA